MSRPPLPPFTAETAAQKVRLAEDAWNTRDPARGRARLHACVVRRVHNPVLADLAITPTEGERGSGRLTAIVRSNPARGESSRSSVVVPMWYLDP